ncbi:hypothetical protein EV356DRAFT_565524 [Viridothelium virens]|uniref:Uncharacterized protein n=1 Tax=Viridothelium virens TaxID=1048519 RepID=A0A6A6HEM4_VIRVR|nr:hypothetical protein EV356DRAFT_565524 [Viridothelium virens]
MYRTALRNPFSSSRSVTSDQILISPPTASSIYGEESTPLPDLKSGESIKPTSPQFADSASLFAPSKQVLQDYQRWLKTNNKDGDASGRDRSMPHSDDPVGMHLLVETAMGDSEEFRILSVEEVEELKKEKRKLSAQIESVRRKLALESKVRDAAVSLTRLYSRKGHSLDSVPTLKRHRRNQKGSDSSVGSRDSDALNQTEDELAVSTRKCDDLSKEMWDLDIRYRAIEGQLLRHTAGVLQATHAGPRVQMKGSDANSLPRPQPPDSPQSVYSTMEKRRTAMTQDDDNFDDRSFYREADQLDGFVDRMRIRQSSIYDSDTDKPLPRPPDSATADTFALSSIASRLATSNKRLRELLRETEQEVGNSNFPEPPEVSTPDPQEQMNYLDELSYEVERVHRSLASQNSSSQDSTIMANLWDLVSANEERAREWKRQQLEDPTQEADTDDDEPAAIPNEQFTPDAFATKVQRLCSRAGILRDQQTILRRQIQQQRDLRTQADASSANLDTLNEEILQARARHAAAETETGDARAELAAVSAELERLRETSSTRSVAQQDATGSTTDTATTAAATAAAAEAEARATKAEDELRNLEGEVVRLTTELTVAKAELDGAYGTRAQRAAEGGADLRREVEDLSARNAGLQSRAETLQRELEGTLAEYEELVKGSVEAERERDGLEGVCDGLRERVEGLEAKLSEERIRWMGVKSPATAAAQGGVGASPGQETTSTVVLKNEFKRMMRDTRTENLKMLRAEQEERRKLEALLRQMRKDGAPPKSGLSQSTLAA